jgi:uncharacterized tellurite resistance protein B-like protein
MLLDRIRALFHPDEPADTAGARNPGSSASAAPDPLHLAACVLLLEVAYADGEFAPAERAHLERALERHFSIPPDAVQQLIALAEQERGHAIDHFGYTATLLRGYDTAQRMVLAEVMWGVALADGAIADHEHYLTRKIANLLELEPGFLAAAKQAAAREIESGQKEPG